VDAVLFDLYDTLVWTEWPLLRERLSEAIGATEGDLMKGFERTHSARGVGTFGSAEGDIEAVLREAGGSPSREQVRELTNAAAETLLDGGVHLFEDSLPVLRELRRRGVRTVIVSNCDHLTRPVVDALGLEREVDAVVLSFEVGAMKPDAEIYRVALERVGAAPERTTFVDDQPGYLDGAAALGMRTVQVVRGTDPSPLPAGAHPVVEDLWAVVSPG
jgi:putative hydrolase of the HAD superfamily